MQTVAIYARVSSDRQKEEQTIASQTAAAEQVELDILGHRFAQPPFRYQVKCYSRLKSLYANLSRDTKDRVDGVLEKTDCHRWLI